MELALALRNLEQQHAGRRVLAKWENALFVERNGQPTLEVREWPLAASLFGGSGDVKRKVPHLAHFWPRAASTSATVDIGVKLPDLWLFEHVQGAVVEGPATPQSVVSATLQLGGRLPYTAWTVTDAAGHFALRLPIPTGIAADRGLATSEAWTLTVDGVTRPVAITEDDVRQAHTIALSPDKGAGN